MKVLISTSAKVKVVTVAEAKKSIKEAQAAIKAQQSIIAQAEAVIKADAASTTKQSAADVRKYIRDNGITFSGESQRSGSKEGSFAIALRYASMGGKLYEVRKNRRTLICTFSNKSSSGSLLKGWRAIWTKAGKKYSCLA